MKKVLNLLALLLTTAAVAFGQTQTLTVAPLETAEQCPATNITFSVIIPAVIVDNSTPNISPLVGNPAVLSIATNVVRNTSAGNTTFTFIGKFRDENSTQAFEVSYQTVSGSFNKPLTYKKIKSFAFSSSFSNISTNSLTISAPICETTTHPISFSNVSFGNGTDASVTPYGSVTSYEYLLPNGWRLGSSTSNGSNWITGSNSVVVMSDLATGNNSSILVRAINPCGASLIKGPIAGIAIIRPKPALTFTGNSAVCSSQEFKALNTPSWVTNYAWQVTPTSIFGNANPNSNPTTVTKLANGEGNIQLTISSNTCPATFTYNTQEITGQPTLVAGPPVVNSNQALAIYNAPGDENELCLNVENTMNFSTTGKGQTTTNWTYVSHTGSPQPSWSQVGATDLYVYFFRARQKTLVLKMTTTNGCGSIVYDFGFKAVDCALRTAAVTKVFRVSPNPVSDLLTISPVVVSETTPQITEVVVSDFNSQTVMRKAFGNVSTAQLNIGNLRRGTYIITVISGSRQETHTVTKQ